jgi:hypothetical protein
MSDAVFSLQGAVALRARIPTWAAAPTALPERQTARLCSWHACASVWIATSFRQRPRIHKHANAWWSMHLHTLLLDTSKAQLAYVSDLCRHHRHMHSPGLYTPRPCAIKINPRTHSAAEKGQHSTERVSTAHSHTWTTGAPAGGHWQGRVAARVGRDGDKEGRFRKFRTVAF